MYYTTFWTYIQSNDIEIPIIQRDYAQGRLGKENLRKNFLRDLKNALDNDGKKMKLDFVYGSMEEGKLYPLDGQQRLTTLWLLHWYIALRTGELNNDNCAILKKFTYETRISSREFCEKLCEPENFENFNGNDIVGFITKQTWFYSAWKQDPTIQSMLRMLGGTKVTNKKNEDIVDGIEELFNCSSECFIDGKVYCVFKSYWEELTSGNAPIVFYHLPLKDFGLSDDLYIKMNARGKQLTSFENFKADLIGYITNQAEDKSLEESVRAEWMKLIDPESGIPIKIDTDWTDIFWKNKSKGLTDNESKTRKSNQIDEIYFAFLNRFFWNELFIARNSDNKYILDIGKGDESSTQENNNQSYKYLNNSVHNNDVTIAYNGLDVYRYYDGVIPLSFFQKIKRVLDNYFVYKKDKNCLPECTWDTSFRFIPQYNVDDSGNNIEIENNAQNKILSVSTLNQVQRVVFFAVCKYFDHDDNVSDSKESLKRWMRVVWNLVSGEDQNGRPEIRSTSALRAAIKFIDSLESHDVYKSLRDYEITLGNSSFEERCKEEIAKAKQILNGKTRPDGKTWEEIIIEAEKYAFFKGAIRFLFTDGNGNIIWADFDTKWGNAQKYFDENGVKEVYRENAYMLRYYISQFKEWWMFSDFPYDNETSTWKSILISNRFAANHMVLKQMPKDSDLHNLSNFVASLEKYDDGYEDLQNNVQNDLVKTTILFEASKWRSKLNWRYNTYCLYPYYNRTESKVYVIGNHRNQILSSLCDKEQINDAGERRFGDNNNFFWGWDIQFKYQDKCFQWHREGYVRMIEDLVKCEPIVKDESKDAPEEKWYCFWPTQEMASDTSQFTEALDNLIKQSQKS